MCIHILLVLESQDTVLEGVIEIIFSSTLQNPFCGLSLLCNATGYNVVGTSPLCSKQWVELIQTHFSTIRLSRNCRLFERIVNLPQTENSSGLSCFVVSALASIGPFADLHFAGEHSQN